MAAPLLVAAFWIAAPSGAAHATGGGAAVAVQGSGASGGSVGAGQAQNDPGGASSGTTLARTGRDLGPLADIGIAAVVVGALALVARRQRLSMTRP
ncbi:MAG TPA: hypothetical protein VGM93_01720 [Acidimicrobiales bacterium]